jgi:hypothetical protein
MPALDAQQAAALDSAAALLRHDPARRVLIRYTTPVLGQPSNSSRLAQRAWDRLVARGVDADRMRRVRVTAVNGTGLLPGLDAIEVVVERGPVGSR